MLIFNTNIVNPRTPIAVIDPSKFGVNPTTQVPVVLGYDLSHYESLHPSDDIDIKKSIDLVKMLEEGRYDKTYHDLSNLVCLEDIPTIIGDVNQKVNESEKNQDKIHVQLFLDNRETNITDLSKRKTANEKHDQPNSKKKKIKEMTEKEKKGYYHEKYIERREKLGEIGIEYENERCKELQKKKKKENKEEYLEKQRLQKREQRLIQRTTNKEEYQEKERESRQKTEVRK